MEKSELAQRSEVAGLLDQLLGKAYRFNSLCMAPIKNIQTEFSDLIYQPRDYLETQVSQSSEPKCLWLYRDGKFSWCKKVETSRFFVSSLIPIYQIKTA